MANQLKKGRQYLKNGYWAMVGALSAMIISLQPVMADTIWGSLFQHYARYLWSAGRYQYHCCSHCSCRSAAGKNDIPKSESR